MLYAATRRSLAQQLLLPPTKSYCRWGREDREDLAAHAARGPVRGGVARVVGPNGKGARGRGGVGGGPPPTTARRRRRMNVAPDARTARSPHRHTAFHKARESESFHTPNQQPTTSYGGTGRGRTANGPTAAGRLHSRQSEVRVHLPLFLPPRWPFRSESLASPALRVEDWLIPTDNCS